jgi:hypothetical protein
MPLPPFARPAVARFGLLLLLTLLTSCSTTWPRRDPTGEVFPTVTGTSLAGDAVTLPTLGAGAPLLLLIGYEQEAQFDLDRWLLGLDQAGWRVRTFEVPTLPGLFPRLLAGTIDSGMRRGIPAEDWASVVTVYGDARAPRRVHRQRRWPDRPRAAARWRRQGGVLPRPGLLGRPLEGAGRHRGPALTATAATGLPAVRPLARRCQRRFRRTACWSTEVSSDLFLDFV